jgi:methyl-accepting chemotaxis protein
MGFVANIKIGKRLGLGFALILAMTVVISAVGAWRMNKIADRTKAMMAVPLAKERLITDWYTLNFASIRRTAAIAKSADPSLGAYFKEDSAASVKKAAELLKQIEPLIAADGPEKDLFTKILGQRKVYSASRDGTVKAKADGNAEEAARILEKEFTPAAQKYQDLLQELVAMQRNSMNETAGAIDSNADSSTQLIVILCACALALGGVMSWLLTRGIVQPIRDAVKVAETVASGDLTRSIEVRSNDETGSLLRALRHMNDSLVGIVSQVRGGTDTIATASREISAGNLDLSSRTEQQAGALEETAASMEELTTTVRQNADNARQANQLAIAASEVATQGGAVVGEVITTMGAINDSSQRIVNRVAEIDGLVSEISASAQEQATGLQQVNTAVNQMDQVTQQNAAMVEQSTAASHSLSQEADVLAASVSRFRTGQAAAPVAARKPAPVAHAAPVRAAQPVAQTVAALRGGVRKPSLVVVSDGWEEF